MTVSRRWDLDLGNTNGRIHRPLENLWPLLQTEAWVEVLIHGRRSLRPSDESWSITWSLGRSHSRHRPLPVFSFIGLYFPNKIKLLIYRNIYVPNLERFLTTKPLSKAAYHMPFAWSLVGTPGKSPDCDYTTMSPETFLCTSNFRTKVIGNALKELTVHK